MLQLRTIVCGVLLAVSGCECDEPLRAPPGRIEGVACDVATGLPQAGVEINIRIAGRSEVVTTDESGRYTLQQAPSGKAEVTLPGDRTLMVEVQSNDTVIVDDTACRAPPTNTFGDVAGRVCNRHVGDPVTDGLARITLPDGSTRDAFTDEDGYFLLTDVPAGPQILTITAEGFAKTEPIVVVAGEQIDVDIGGGCAVLPPADVGGVSGRICAPDGAAWLADATVYIDPNGNADERIQTSTDGDGHYTLSDVPVGTQTVHIEKGAFAASFVVDIVAGEVTVLPEAECPVLPPSGLGGVSGRVCAPDGSTWLADATVYIDPNGIADERIQTSTDGNGSYTLSGVPAGTQTVHIEKGAFSTSFEVEIVAGEVTVLPQTQCELEAPTHIAVVHGSFYDNVEGVLAEIGVPSDHVTVFASTWAEELLSDDHGLDAYQVLFLNCRSFEGTYAARPDMQERLRAFVEAGGKLYASDQAYDLIEITWPDRIDFRGDDTIRGAGDQGNLAEMDATIVDASLAAAMGSASLHLHYGLTTWSNIESVSAGVDIYVVGDSPLLDGSILYGAPQLVGFYEGDGHVVYASFHEEPGIGAQQERVLQLVMFEL